jgi:hypothetical protein
MSRSNGQLLEMVVDALSPSIKIVALEVDKLPGQHGLFFPDAEDAVALVFFVLAEKCGSGSDEQRLGNLLGFVLAEARKALPPAVTARLHGSYLF